MSKKEYTINWADFSEDVVYSVGSKTTLNFLDTNFSDLTFNIHDNILYCSNGVKTLKFIKFSKVKYAKTLDGTTNLINDGEITNTDVITNYKKKTVKGTIYSDTIDVHDYANTNKDGIEIPDTNKTQKGLTIKSLSGNDFITATKYADTINAGAGNDTLYSSLGNDKFAGGTGQNTVVYTGEFDTDTITLTKNETLILNLSSYNITDLNDLKFNISSNNLELTVRNDNSTYGKIILKGFKKNNVVGKNGDVYVTLNGVDNLSLNTENILNYDITDFSTKGVFKGSRFSETIDATGLNTEFGKNNKGVTINAGEGYNTIYSTYDFNDNITGGNDGNDITLHSGNKLVKTGSGDDIITCADIGNKDLYLGGGSNTIIINNSSYFGDIVLNEQKVTAKNTISFMNELSDDYIVFRQKNNLVLKNEASNSQITINDYYKNIKKHAEYTFKINGIEYSLSDTILSTKGFLISGKGTLTGMSEKDLILADDIDPTEKISDDIIIPRTGNDTINAGFGKNTIQIKNGDGNKTILYGGGRDTLCFEEGTNLLFDIIGDDLIITYSDDNETVTIDNYVNQCSVQYLKVGNTKSLLSDNVCKLSSGKSAMLNLSDSVTTQLILTNDYTNTQYRYEITSLSPVNNANIEYLHNGRVVIYGNNLSICASDGQNDDIILLGDNNTINTYDLDDNIRIGYAIDTNGEANVIKNSKGKLEGSFNNTINSGSGNDHITFFGLGNKIDTGDGYDTLYAIGVGVDISNPDHVIINNTEYARHVTGTDTEFDYQIGCFNQGGQGGDCRLLSMLDSLNRYKNYNSLADYVTITQKDENTYNVEFKNYANNKAGTTNNIDIAKEEISFENFYNVNGDLDVVLIDYAMNRLINLNGDRDKTNVNNAYYNTIANYIFGTEDITIVNFDQLEFKTRLYELWDEYQAGNISNITIGLQAIDSNYKESILTGHAYSLGELTNNYIILHNPWDNADNLMINFEEFMRNKPCVIVYGNDFYNENIIADNGVAIAPSENNIWFDSMTYDMANWISGSNNTCDLTLTPDNKQNYDISTVIAENSSEFPAL